MAVIVGLCKFPLFNFAFTITIPSFSLPALPDLGIDIDLSCPLNED